ncbi:hypothetical protein [Streptomyces sp. NBC_00663]|uniref:hypothetical protein n=1 Tax=Streptomyces sp. NBC_00663 TaxID=2975801 RepID=UPI003FCDC929
MTPTTRRAQRPRKAALRYATTAGTADIVINANPGDSTLDRLTTLRDELAGKIVSDVSDAIRGAADGTARRPLFYCCALGERRDRRTASPQCAALPSQSGAAPTP